MYKLADRLAAEWRAIYLCHSTTALELLHLAGEGLGSLAGGCDGFVTDLEFVSCVVYSGLCSFAHPVS